MDDDAEMDMHCAILDILDDSAAKIPVISHSASFCLLLFVSTLLEHVFSLGCLYSV